MPFFSYCEMKGQRVGEEEKEYQCKFRRMCPIAHIRQSQDNRADLYFRLVSGNDTVVQMSTEFVNNVVSVVLKVISYKLSLYLKIRWTLENECLVSQCTNEFYCNFIPSSLGRANFNLEIVLVITACNHPCL